jgi:hypothetical protein
MSNEKDADQVWTLDFPSKGQQDCPINCDVWNVCPSVLTSSQPCFFDLTNNIYHS